MVMDQHDGAARELYSPFAMIIFTVFLIVLLPIGTWQDLTQASKTRCFRHDNLALARKHMKCHIFSHFYVFHA